MQNVTALRIVEVWWAHTRLRELHHAQCHVVLCKCNGIQCLYSVGTQASTKLNRHGMNILVVKGTAHTRLKEICVKAMVIASASFDIGC